MQRTMRHLLGAGDCGGDFEEVECDSVVYVRGFCAVIGMIGCIFIMGMIILHRTYHNFGQRLIFSLTLSAFLDTIPYFAGYNPNGQLCSFMGFLMTWFDWAVLAWVCCITHKIWVNILYQREPRLINVEQGCCSGNPLTRLFVRWLGAAVVERELGYHLICWLGTFTIAMIPVFWDAYGPAGPWCWIQADHDHSTEFRFGIWYVPLFVLIFLLFISNGYIYNTVRTREKEFQGTYSPEREAEKQFLLTQVAPVKYYPVVFLILQIPPLINRINNAAHPNKEDFTLYILHVICSCFFGACIAAVYAANTDRDIWRQCTRSGIARAWRMRRTGSTSGGEFPVGPTQTNPTLDNDDFEEVNMIDESDT
mmetsp:Transcript_16469/g.42758  ORF Transcript_16469/g.42758 Transcript_16469/m.42758 type:complete len:365 (+) Transcript_16469:189-1283(+)